jgi:hypothetical protein
MSMFNTPWLMPSDKEPTGLSGKHACVIAETPFRVTLLLSSAAKDEDSGEMVAIKKITSAFEHHTFAKRTLREITLMRMMQHENVNDQLLCTQTPI